MPRKKKSTAPQYQFGRRSPKQAPALRFAHFFTGIIPAHPNAVDYAAKLLNWLMLGNDQYGDCVAVSWANMVRLVTAFLSTEYYPSLAQVIDVYRTQNPNFPTDDNGMDIQTMLEYLQKQGGPDGRKLVAFATVDVHNADEVEAAVAIFGGIILGFLVREHNMYQFATGQPWTYDPTQQVVGGHAVLVGGYDKAMGWRFNTWAEETSMDLSFVNSPDVEEAWVLIFPEHLGTKAFQEGVDLAQLAADYEALTGKVLPVPLPPTPPPPTPTPTPSILDLILAFLKWLWRLLIG